jgi:8-oxo-dGTP pyrophosphatase MutT (NUDIX family)
VRFGNGAITPVLAAGGVVWRPTSFGSEIAVIHRHQCHDWCLPKGKPKTGETFQQTAQRVVFEEIGCDARITSFAGTTSYSVPTVPTSVHTVPKIVAFWNMEPTGGSTFRTSKEVDQVVWLSPRKAIALLDYAAEKNLIATVSPDHSTSVLSKMQPLLHRLWHRLAAHRRYRRLAATVEVYRVELENRIQQCRAEGAAVMWLHAAQGSLKRVDTALQQHDLDMGWQCLLAAQRMELPAFSDEEALLRREALQNEVNEKLQNWRKETALALLKANQTPPQSISRVRLQYVTGLRDEHFHNQYFRMGYLERVAKWRFT